MAEKAGRIKLTDDTYIEGVVLAHNCAVCMDSLVFIVMNTRNLVKIDDNRILLENTSSSLLRYLHIWTRHYNFIFSVNCKEVFTRGSVVHRFAQIVQGSCSQSLLNLSIVFNTIVSVFDIFLLEYYHQATKTWLLRYNSNKCSLWGQHEQRGGCKA